MQKVLTAVEMREVDRLTTERYGIPSIILMENAAHAVAGVITEKLGGSVKGKSILVLCGKGNNGGDGAAVARILHSRGADLEVFLFGELEEAKGDARIQFEALRKLQDHQSSNKLSFEPSKLIDEWVHTTGIEVDKFDLVVDALFGTGLNAPLGSIWKDIPSALNGLSVKKERIIVSIDVPSGIDSDSSQVPDIHVTADHTVTFTSPKQANVLAPVHRYNGELIVANIGSPQPLVNEQPSQLFVTERSDVAAWMRETAFTPGSYKNKRGHALIIAGSENYAGAAILCGNAAIRSGVGLVTIGTPRSSKDLVGGRVVPEVMVRPLAETESGAVSEEAIEEIERFSKNINAIAIGAGLSASDESTGRFVRHFLENRTMPTLLDADALTLLAPFERVTDGQPVILTPHEGEFMRLLGTDDKNTIKDRIGAVRRFAQEKNVVLVLKGERNLIGEPGGKVVVNPTGNSGLGKAGNGDTLLGILAGFVAQAGAMNIDIFETVVAAVYVAGLAGDIAAEKFGQRVMTATDTRDALADAFRRCETENG
jgi:NAD(P)H-hydrate epimerase